MSFYVRLHQKSKLSRACIKQNVLSPMLQVFQSFALCNASRLANAERATHRMDTADAFKQTKSMMDVAKLWIRNFKSYSILHC